jgi:predicted methyltransferase
MLNSALRYRVFTLIAALALNISVGSGNVQVIANDSSGTNLPAECCDAIFIRYVYHHFADPPAMNASVRQALKPGGALAIIEFAPRTREGSTPAGRAADETHGVGAQSIVRELKDAGFEVVSSEQQPDRTVRVVARKLQ